MARTLTIERKLYLSFGSLTLLTLFMVWISINLLTSLRGTVEVLGIKAGTKLYYAGQIDGEAGELRVYMHKILEDGIRHNTAATALDIDKYHEIEKVIVTDLDAMRSIGMGQTGLDMTYKLQEQLEQSKPIAGRLVDASERADPVAAEEIRDHQLAPVIAEIGKTGTQLIEQQRIILQETTAVSQASVDRGRWIMFGLLMLSLAVAAVLLVIIRRLNAQLHRTVKQLNEGSVELASAANQASAASQSLAADASRQAAIIEKTSASSEEINSMARRNLSHVATANDHMMQLKKIMETSARDMQNALLAMQEILQGSDQISSVIKTIDQIAFQTNILALNAAVEAARAGDAGAGFAVVADEVRNLAQRSAEAAKNTADLIGKSQTSSQNGQQRVGKVAQEIDQMASALEQMNSLVEQIAAGSQEQGTGIHQIAQSMSRLEQGIQRNAATAQKTSAAAESLNIQSATVSSIAVELAALVGAAA
jgi:methyl-accepting chemotaxis protein/methyl-accepting chemotaxis protein-1 (serine sensor receptor)